MRPGVTGDTDGYVAGGDGLGGWGNGCGLPALALPMGFGPGGMPCGFQVVAPAFEEASTMRIGRAFQEATAFHKERPKGV